MLWVLVGHFDVGETIICYFPPIYISNLIKYKDILFLEVY